MPWKPKRHCLQKKNCQPWKIVCLKTENLSILIHKFDLIHFGKKVFKRQFLLAEFCIVNRRHCFKTQAHLRNTHLFLNTERSQKTNLYSISLWNYFFLHYLKN